jgi:hypothetical protein
MVVTKSDWFGIALTFLGVAAGFLMGGTIAGVVCLFVGVVALVVWHRTNDNPTNLAGAPVLKQWGKLQKRFEQLDTHAATASHRIQDPLTMVGAERLDDPDAPYSPWRITSADFDCQKDAAALCKLAGALLLSSRVHKSIPNEIIEVPDHSDRWLFFLKHLGEATVPEMQMQKVSEVDGIMRFLSMDDIPNVAKASVRGCLESLTHESDESVS